MKNFKYVLAFLFAFSVIQVTAQIFGNDPEIKIDGLQAESVWQIAEMAMNENEIPIGQLNFAENVLMSDWIEWKAIAIQNHARLYFKFEEPSLTVKIADRQYKSQEGWSEAVGNLSKKNYKKYVQDVADRIEEISKDEVLTRQAVKTSKLIPAFNAVNVVGDLEWKLLSVVQTENTQPEFVFEITNNGNSSLKIRTYTSEFQEINGTGTARAGVKWEKPDANDYKYTVIEPGESARGFFAIGTGYHLKTTKNHYLHMKYAENDDVRNQKEFKVYSVPMPYQYQEGD